MSAHWNKLLGRGRAGADIRLHGAPERGHSCPQQRPNAPRLPEFSWFSFHSTLLRTRMSALRGCGVDALRSCAVMASVLLGSTMFAGAAESQPPSSPQQFYNQGTQKFREGKLREAESSLQVAVASQNEKVQIPALYNLGHVRFREGIDDLKGGPNAKASEAAANRANADAESAIQSADLALAGWDVNAIAAAYMQGRGARKELKAATEAVKLSLESYGAVLARWQRASGDFKSAHELNVSDQDAQANAEVVDRSIARLVDSQKLVMQCSQCTKKNGDSLKQKMAELKQRLPKELKKQCENGEEEEDEDSDKPPKEPKAGQQEPKPNDGQAKLLTPEEAARLLDMLRLDSNRKLPLGMNDTGAVPKDRKRRDW